MDKGMDRSIGNTRLTQIGLLVNDIEGTGKEFVRFFGVEGPGTINSGEYKIIHTEYRREPAPKAKRYMTSFYFGNLQMELIQPDEEPSIWWGYLEQFGEGIHHMSFNVKGIQKTTSVYEGWGMELLQRGEYKGANGRYVFMNALNNPKVVVELSERDEQEKVR